MACFGDQQRAVSACGAFVQALCKQCVASTLHEHHRIEHRTCHEAAVRIAHVATQGRLLLGREWRVEPEGVHQRWRERSDPFASNPHGFVAVDSPREDWPMWATTASNMGRYIDQAGQPDDAQPTALGQVVHIARVRS